MEKGENYSYIFQSGKYKGSSLVAVMAIDPIHVSKIYQASFKGEAVIKNPNQLQHAITSLLGKIREIDATKKCPYCKERKVKHFLLPDYGLISNKLVCCDDESCQRELKSCRSGELHEIADYLLIISFLPKTQAKRMVGLFKQTHKNTMIEMSV